MGDYRTRSQWWADTVTAFSGSWTFIIVFATITAAWIVLNAVLPRGWDPYPFMFLNWVLTVVSTLQNPIILLSQNRQNEMDEEARREMQQELCAVRHELKVMNDRLAIRISDPFR